jgi:hypothetical protein
MTARKVRQPQPAVAWYVADRTLPVSTEMGAEAFPVRAFNAGDRVPVEHVEKFGWHDYVHPWPEQAADDTEGDSAPAEPAEAPGKKEE